MYNQPVCLRAFNACLCTHAVFVCLSLTVRIIMCALVMAWICVHSFVRVRVCVFMRERKKTDNTALTKIQHGAFVKVTPIHLAWQQFLYLFSYSHMSFLLHSG